jgi:hypothetical protein
MYSVSPHVNSTVHAAVTNILRSHRRFLFTFTFVFFALGDSPLAFAAFEAFAAFSFGWFASFKGPAGFF